MATSKSAEETFARLGMFGKRDVTETNHVLDPNAREIDPESDISFAIAIIVAHAQK